ncbi:MAG: hypothetical protein AB3N20_12450 [Rhizobiaceae bacterium]
MAAAKPAKTRPAVLYFTCSVSNGDLRPLVSSFIWRARGLDIAMFRFWRAPVARYFQPAQTHAVQLLKYFRIKLSGADVFVAIAATGDLLTLPGIGFDGESVGTRQLKPGRNLGMGGRCGVRHRQFFRHHLAGEE